MPYNRQTWVDGDLTRPLSAERMNHLEQGLADAHALIAALGGTSAPEIGAPTAPVNAAYTQAPSATGATVSISWEPPMSDGGSPITGYRVSRNGTDVNGYGVYSTDLAAAARSFIFYGLRPGDTYEIRISALNATGEGATSLLIVAVASTVTDPTDPVDPPTDPVDPGTTEPLQTTFIAPVAQSGTQLRALRQGIPWVPPEGPGHFHPEYDFARMRVDTYDGPLDPESAQMAQDFVNQAAVYTQAGLNTTQYNAHYWAVDTATPTMPVAWWPWRSAEVKRPRWDDIKHSKMPLNIFPSNGNDSAVIIHDPVTGEVWEWWKLILASSRENASKQTLTWKPEWTEPGSTVQAAFGGYIHDTKTNRGRFENIDNLTYGTAATSLSYLGTALAVSDIVNGSINHAVNIQVIDARSWSDVSWPALRGDGPNNGARIRQGQRYRFPPGLNFWDTAAFPGMTYTGRLYCEAGQKYGIIPTDKSGALSVAAESGSVGMQADGSYQNPWTGTNGINAVYNGGSPNYAVMKNVPWHLIQALPKDWGKTLTVSQTMP